MLVVVEISLEACGQGEYEFLGPISFFQNIGDWEQDDLFGNFWEDYDFLQNLKIPTYTQLEVCLEGVACH